MPFLAYIRAPEPEVPKRRSWRPDWRVWGPALAAMVALLAGAQIHGVVGLALVLGAFALAYRALDSALPYCQGLREWRQ